MVAAGFIEQSIERCVGRGRPRHRFAATKAAMVLLFANNQQLVVPAIWKAVEDIGGEKLKKKILRSVGRALAKHYSAKITATEPRSAIRAISGHSGRRRRAGGLGAEDGHLVIKKRTCGFISMSNGEEDVCAIDMALLSAVAGCPVRRTACRHEGAPCCQFEIATPAAKRLGAVRSDGARRITWR